MANNHALDFGRGPLPAMFRRSTARRSTSWASAGTRRGVRALAARRRRDDGRHPRRDGRGADPTADPTGQWAATDTSAGTADALDPARLLRAVRQANRTTDVVVAYLHWGVQGELCPSDLQRSLARRLVAAGADVVVGSHTHGLQGDGRLGPGYVAYGLGNFAWYSESLTGVLTLTVQPPASPAGRAHVTDASWEAARVTASGLPVAMNNPAMVGFDDDLLAARACSGLR